MDCIAFFTRVLIIFVHKNDLLILCFINEDYQILIDVFNKFDLIAIIFDKYYTFLVAIFV